MVVIGSGLVAVNLGPGKTFAQAFKAVPLCALGRAAFFFIKTLPQKVPATLCRDGGSFLQACNCYWHLQTRHYSAQRSSAVLPVTALKPVTGYLFCLLQS